MRILMISGKSASGKDTVADFMERLLTDRGERVLKIHFGDLVKALLRACYGWNGIKDAEGRSMLQKLGTDIMRNRYPTYWAEVVSKFISATYMDWDWVLIPDWRFINELDTICEYNHDVTTIRVERITKDGEAILNPDMTMRQAEHQSENELDDFVFEWVIENSGTLEQLYDSAVAVLEGVMNEKLV